MSGRRLSDYVAPVRDLMQVPDALSSWRWLAPPDARPILLTALGDVFLDQADGRVAFLDTYRGHYGVVAESRELWNAALRDGAETAAWFALELVDDLRRCGMSLGEGQCYSPNHPLILGGKLEPDNFDVTDWRVHVGMMGQLYEQVSKLPPGTPIKIAFE